MLVTIELKIRHVIDKLVSLLLRLIKMAPVIANRNTLIDILYKTKQKLSINLFDDEDFLSYVKMKKIGLEKNALTIKTISLGSSHSDYSFYSPMWENTYNLGLTSGDIFTSYQLYENNKRKLINLQYIIFFFSVFTAGNSLINTTERYRAVVYKYFLQIPYAKSGTIKSRFEKIIRHKCGIVSIKNNNPNYTGYNFKTYYGVKLSVTDRAKKHLRENRREPNQLEWLQKLSQSIKQDNRKLIIVLSPCRSDYRDMLPAKEELFHKLYNLGLNDVEFLNFYDSDLFTDEDMGDTDHLNEKGAKKLTSEIQKYFAESNF
jgi:hypothetical protein